MWTEDRVESLKKLWREGKTNSEIAGILGGITRNAVIGKVHRLGLGGRAEPATPKPIKSGTRKISDPEAKQPKAETLIGRKKESEGCRYIIGSEYAENIQTCGAVRRAGSSYCEFHHRKTHQDTPPQY